MPPTEGPGKPEAWALLEMARTIILEAAARECEGCDEDQRDKTLLWRGEDQPELYLHGSGEEVGECESRAMQDAVDAGVLPIAVYAKCANGHEWYGTCPECEEGGTDD